MAIDLYLDPLTNDLDLTGNRLRLTTKKEESTRQQILIRLSTYKGEWIYNILFGVPYLKNGNNKVQLLGAGDNKTFLDAEIRDAILSAENVVQIQQYTSTYDRQNRKLVVSFEVRTIFGDIVSVEDLELG